MDIKKWVGIFITVLVFTASCAQNQNISSDHGVAFLDLTNVQISLTQEISDNPPTNTPLIIPSETVAPATPTNEPMVAAEISQTTSTAPPAPTQGCSNRVEFIKHLNVSDNTEFKPETYFAKVWLVKNSGTCVWSSGYKLVFIGGDPMGANLEIQLTNEVPPGDTIELRVNFQAPLTPATYSNEWMLSDANNDLFGIGETSSSPLRVQIIVVRPHVPLTL